MPPFPGIGSRQTATSAARTGSHLVPDYRPSRPHGWQGGPNGTVGMTIGGHTTTVEFTHGGRSYVIDLLPAAPHHPVYEDVPADSTLDFQLTLNAAFGAHYSFHYTGGFRGRDEFAVQSFSVFAQEATDTSPLLYGADLYVVYRPDVRAGDPTQSSVLRWIQVVRTTGETVPPDRSSPFVDNEGRANPFYPFGGPVSIHGDRLVNANCGAIRPVMPEGEADLTGQVVAELFLVRDTGVEDAAGKGIVHVFGGIKYGWQVRAAQS